MKKFFFALLFMVSPIFLWSYSSEDNIEEHFRFGYELFNAGRFEEAEIEFRNLLLIQPDLALGYLWLGKTLEKKELKTEAVEVWKKGLESEPSHKELRALLGSKIVEGIEQENRIRNSNSMDLIGKKEHLYKINEGDTLQGIAEKFFGNRNMAAKIASYNQIESLKEIGVGGELKLPVTEAELKKYTQSEELEKQFVENQNSGKMVAAVTETAVIDEGPKPENSVDINKMEPSLNNGVMSGNPSGNSSENPSENSTAQTELASTGKTSEPAKNASNEFDPEKEEEYSKICKDHRSSIEGAILDYNLDNAEEMKQTNFDLNVLKKEGYLDKDYVCPVPGSTYSMSENGDVKCSYHSIEGN